MTRTSRIVRRVAVGLCCVALAWAALCVAPGAPAPAAAEEPAISRLALPATLPDRNEWFGIYIQGRKCGYAHRTATRGHDGAPWVVAFEVHIDLTSLGQQVAIDNRERTEFDAAAPFALRSAVSEQRQGGETKTVTVTRGESGYAATIVAGGQQREMALPDLDFTLADSLAMECFVASAPADGTVVRVRSYDVGDLEGDVDRLTLQGREQTVAGGVPVEYLTLQSVSESDGVVGSARVTAGGDLLSMTLGAFAEVRLEPEEAAKTIEISSDLFVLGMARVDKRLGTSAGVRDLVLEVKGAGAEHLADGPRQAVTRDAETGAVVLSLGAKHGDPVPASADEIADALKETVEYPIRNASIVALAKQAVGDATTPREQVQRLVAFVSEFVEDALAADAPSVERLLETRRGDCTEHALLFTTIARAAGIPTREASGLLYIGDKARAFGGHAWNEVVLDGHWEPVDATWNQTEIDATHIRFGAGGSSTGTMLATFGQLSFQLRSLEREP